MTPKIYYPIENSPPDNRVVVPFERVASEPKKGSASVLEKEVRTIRGVRIEVLRSKDFF